MPNRNGIDTGAHPARVVNGARWNTRDYGYLNSADPANNASFAVMPSVYETESGYGDVYSTSRIGGNPDWYPGRSHSGFMAAYERHGGRLHPDDPTPRFEAGPFSTPGRAQLAASAMHNRYERGGDLSQYER